MSHSELNKWKKKAQELSVQLKEQKQIIREYEKTLQKSNHLLQSVIEKLSLELKAAHQIHHILLPTVLPVIQGCKFSFKFKGSNVDGCGKDFYEIVPHSVRKSFSITMFSCFSYSLSSLLVSARLKMMGYSRGMDNQKPHEFIMSLIKEISEYDQYSPSSPLRMDLFYAVIDQKTYEMSYCLVGDIIVFVHSSRPGTIKQINPCVTDLKSKNLKKLKSEIVSLNRGDRLIVCSPGVLNDQQDLESNSYSLPALKKSIQQESESSVHELRNRIMYDVQQFSKQKSIIRDQSILVMEINNRVLKLAKSKAK